MQRNRLGIVILMLILIFGCSASNIVQRGEYIDRKSIPIGTPRQSVLAQFGAPADTIIKDDTKIDIFRIVQGEKSGSKTAKATGAVILGVFTLGLSEIVAAPITKDKDYVSFEVYYDSDDRVRSVRFLE